MLCVRIALALIAIFVAATSASSSSQAAQGKVLLIGVGGNSECFGDDSGMKDLYHSGTLVKGLAHALYGADQIEYRYFSWTGEADGGVGCLPGYLDWIAGGSAHILDTLRPVLGGYSTIVIVGWSNGGATAYELACAFTKTSRRVDLLVTLDPASWTTRPCRADADPEQPVKPARRWVAVYTKSQGRASLAGSNIIALFGNAWNDQRLVGTADTLIKLEPGTHGQTQCMWRKCVLNDRIFTGGGRGANPYRYFKEKDPDAKICDLVAKCAWQR